MQRRMCGWCKEVKGMPIPYEGNKKNPVLMFIERNPGREEVEQILRETITSVTGHAPTDFRIVHLVKCFTKDNKAPSKNCMINCYSNHLCDEIIKTNPRAIVLLGNDVASFILHRKVEATKEHGDIVEYLDRPTLITVHPGRVKRGNPNVIEEDLKKLWSELDMEVI